MNKVLISISGQKNNESFPLCSLDRRSIPDPHFILNLAIFHERKRAIQYIPHSCVLKDLSTTQYWFKISSNYLVFILPPPPPPTFFLQAIILSLRLIQEGQLPVSSERM